MAVEAAPEALVEEAIEEIKPEPHAKQIDKLVKQLQGRLGHLQQQYNATTDERKELQYLSEMREIRRTLEWLPEAKTIPALPVRFASRINKYGTVHTGARGVINRPLRLNRYIFDTSDPIEIAALRHHMSRNIQPQIEEIPLGHTPVFVGGRRPTFFGFLPEEQATEAIQSGAANVILP